MVVVQLVRTLHLGCRGRRFESCLPYEIMGVYTVTGSGLDCRSSAYSSGGSSPSAPTNINIYSLLLIKTENLFMAKYHYFYKITNNINNHFYYGVHNTNNLDDGYMGSGKRLHYAYEKYGIENFTKEILKFFDNSEDAFNYEAEIVTEDLVYNNDCYNIQQGGKTFNTTNCITVKYKDEEEYFIIPKNKYDKNVFDTVWTNRHHKKDSREKTRKTMTKNGKTGKRTWINKNGIVKYALNEKLESFLNDNWELGRPGYTPRKGCQGKTIK